MLVTDPPFGGTGRRGVVYAVDAADAGDVATPNARGLRRNLTLEAEKAFWAWACVEVFRHTGVRIEEMLEITHRSFVSYTLPSTGEVIPMLQITPSKTDKERLLVISPELAVVFAEIIARVRDGQERLPLVSRYDHAERLHPRALPFLFQRRWGLRAMQSRTCASRSCSTSSSPRRASPTSTAAQRRFSPHDFRRIFATEAVAGGLPVHITAKILGHESLATTQTYVAVYDQRRRRAPPRVPRPPTRHPAARNTANPPTASGTNSSVTSPDARSNSASAAAPTAPAASTSTPASAVPCCAPTPPNSHGSNRSSPA